MVTVGEIGRAIDEIAPGTLAEDWDNVGLLIGDPSRPASRVMTCLTLTPESVSEAVRCEADLVVAHHPLPFRPLKRLTTETTVGKLLLDLIQSHISVYSPHTAFDSATRGINQQLAEAFSLHEIRPLKPASEDPEVGSGRYGTLSQPQTMGDCATTLKSFLGLSQLQMVGSADKRVTCIGVACGSAGEFLTAAQQQGCDLFITGETSFHTCLEAQALNVGLMLTGHFASERFAVEKLAESLQGQFPDLEVWPSRDEANPLRPL